MTSKEAPLIILVPHSSVFDSFVASLFSIPTFVAREDLKNIFFFGCNAFIDVMHFIRRCDAAIIEQVFVGSAVTNV